MCWRVGRSLIIGLLLASIQVACAVGTGTPSRETSCQDGRDEDGDGATDCADPDCSSDPACSSPSRETNCADNIDNDGDGATDCADTDCSSDAACSSPPRETNCSDGIDNDGDRLVDCDDPDCSADSSCSTSSYETSCTDGTDNDQDGFTDCSDPDCSNDPACSQPTGSLSCMGIWACFLCCPDTDNTCLQACYDAGTQAGQTALSNLADCQVNQCSTECDGTNSTACSNCMDANCRTELDACTWDPSGTDGCYTLSNCLSNCPNMISDGTGNASTCPDQNGNSGLYCTQDCYHQASPTGYRKWNDYLDCAWQYCRPECYDNYDQIACNDCLGVNCSVEGQACVDDG